MRSVALLAVLLLTGQFAVAQKSHTLDQRNDKEYSKDIQEYLAVVSNDINTLDATPAEYMLPDLKGGLVFTLKLDVSLVDDQLRRLKHHQIGRDLVEKYVAQLSRDFENAESIPRLSDPRNEDKL